MGRIAYTIFSARLYPERYQSLIRRIRRAINASLKLNHQRRMEEAGIEIEALLASYPPLHKEALHRMKGCYKATANRAPPPT